MKLNEISTTEAWKQITDWPKYEVSNTGKVRSIATKKLIAPWQSSRRGEGTDLRVSLYKPGPVKWLYVDGERKQIQPNIKKGLRVHRLVAMAFLPNPENLPEVDHKDGNSHNNDVSNLEWVSSAENIRRRDVRWQQ